MDKKKIITIALVIYHIANDIVMILGFGLLVMLAAYSTEIINGFPVEKATLDLKLILYSSPDMPYYLMGIFIVASIGFVIKTIYEIKTGIIKARNTKMSNGQKAKGLLFWILKN